MASKSSVCSILFIGLSACGGVVDPSQHTGFWSVDAGHGEVRGVAIYESGVGAGWDPLDLILDSAGLQLTYDCSRFTIDSAGVLRLDAGEPAEGFVDAGAEALALTWVPDPVVTENIYTLFLAHNRNYPADAGFSVTVDGTASLQSGGMTLNWSATYVVGNAAPVVETHSLSCQRSLTCP